MVSGTLGWYRKKEFGHLIKRKEFGYLIKKH